MKILQEAHSGEDGGHFRVKKTLERMRRDFYELKIPRETCKFVVKCDICHRNKTKNIAQPTLLQPLPILEQIWSDIFMDFIEEFLKSHSREVGHGDH